MGISGSNFLRKGAILDLPEEKAKAWVEGGYAEYLTDKRPVAKPVKRSSGSEQAITLDQTERAITDTNQEIAGEPMAHPVEAPTDAHPLAKILKKRGRKPK